MRTGKDDFVLSLRKFLKDFYCEDLGTLKLYSKNVISEVFHDVLILQVVEVKTSVRTGKDDFVLSLRKSLKDFYGDKVVGLGGVFLIEKGSAHIHIMVGIVCLSV